MSASQPRRHDAVVTAVNDCLATNLYFDRAHGTEAAKLLPGEYYATQRDMLLVTLLGSCVAACIRDVKLGVGGMNHFMLPEGDGSDFAATSARYGGYAMEVLVNHLIKLGAARERLEAKLFGGGNVIAGMTLTNVGTRNAEFATSYLRAEGIRVAAQDLGDVFPRKVHFFPASGRVLVKRLQPTQLQTIAARESSYRSRITQAPAGGDIELFS